MGPNTCYLLTLLSGDKTLFKIAIELRHDQLSKELKMGYYREPEALKYLHSLLPEHIQSIGEVIDASQSIFAVIQYNK